jgi:hypothetical protein
MNPALAERLGIDTAKALTAGDVANLLNGQRADGSDIEGKQKQAGTESVGTVLRMDDSRMPTRAELECVLAGKRVDGTTLSPEVAQRAVRRFQAVLGAKQAELTQAQREDVLTGFTATGGALTVKQYHERMDTSRARIGYVDLTFDRAGEGEPEHPASKLSNAVSLCRHLLLITTYSSTLTDRIQLDRKWHVFC